MVGSLPDLMMHTCSSGPLVPLSSRWPCFLMSLYAVAEVMRSFFGDLVESLTPSPKTFLQGGRSETVWAEGWNGVCLLLPPVHRLDRPLIGLI
jgi:hypothetical protein